MAKRLRQKNFAARFLTKLFHPGEYRKYKAERWSYGITNYRNARPIFTQNYFLDLAASTGSVNLSHSGHTGDIIYSLATAKEMSRLTGVPVNFYLEVGVPSVLKPHHLHPSGSFLLNEDMANLLLPLLAAQPYIGHCEILKDQRIDLNLSLIRELGILLDRGSIARWYNYLSGLYPDPSESWLEAPARPEFLDSIVIARSNRYRNPNIDYAFLSEFDNLVFVGIQSEFEQIKMRIPHIRWAQVADFLELAAVIGSCKLFIGNQSFPFSIAEALKVRRLLEIAPGTPNVIPEGGTGRDFYFQEHFESLVNDLLP